MDVALTMFFAVVITYELLSSAHDCKMLQKPSQLAGELRFLVKPGI